MRDEWIKLIKENMVLVGKGTATYRFGDKEQGSVLIDFGASDLRAVPTKKDPESSPGAAKHQKNVTLDISDESYLIVNRSPSVMRCRQLIPWKRIVGMDFQKHLSPLPSTSNEEVPSPTRS